MKSLILTITTKAILPVMMLFSIFLLLRGHHLPGGGFVGGLTAGAAFVLFAFANGVDATLEKIWLRPVKIIALGLLVAFLSGFPGLLLEGQFFKAYWVPWEVFFLPKLGTPLVFDAGVYLLVWGIVMVIIFPNIKED